MQRKTQQNTRFFIAFRFLTCFEGCLPSSSKNTCHRCVIFNKITSSSIYPDKWKTEYQIPVPKLYPPETADDLRNIAKTPFLSKVYESIIASWPLSYHSTFLGPRSVWSEGFLHYLLPDKATPFYTLHMRQKATICCPGCLY